MINAGVNVADVKAISQNTEIIINNVNVIQNGITSPIWTRSKVLFDTNDSLIRRWRRDAGNYWDVAECQTNGAADNWNVFDCTNFKYCTIRINGNIDSNPAGSSANHTFAKVGFDFESAIDSVDGVFLLHKWNSTGAIGSGEEGLAYNKWYDLTIDISTLSGMQELKTYIGYDGYNNSGTLHCSKITLHN